MTHIIGRLRSHLATIWGTIINVISATRQRFATLGIVALAAIALTMGVIYSDNGGQTNSPYIIGGTSTPAASVAVGAASPGQAAAQPGSATNPIDGLLPKSGTASACSEPIGVDLATGYGARLTINGTEIAPEEMNVVLDSDGNISQTQTAGRSIGHYTFEAAENCPNGPLVRARDNLLEVCVYRLSDANQGCVFRTSHEFDAA